jgi:DsbC/DsbD-like thiol-disulfide interchange protein
MKLNNYCNHPRIRLAALATFLCLPSLWAQNSGTSYLTAEAQKLVVKRGATADAKIAVSVQPNFHVNSNTPSDAYLIPLKLTWTPGGALEPGAVAFPKPRMEKYEFSDKPLSVFTGDFDLTVKFKVPADAPQGPGIMVGKLRYQACNNNSCFPPKTAEVRLPYQVQ